MKLYATAVLVLCGFGLHAQDSLRARHLKEIVVTGEVEPQSLQKSVYNVRTISMERLRAQGATRLQDVLNTELNIRFSQDLALGGSNLTMMGLPGQNVKVLIDGVPLIGRQGTGNEINLNQINIATIERVEIVEGPMAVIYGADALAGVINIVTKKEGDNKLDVSATIHEETVGDEYGTSKGIHNENVNIGYRFKSFYTSANLNRNDFQGYQGDSTGRETTWLPKLQWLAGGVLGYRTSKINTYYRLDFLNEKIYNPAQFQGNEAIDQNYITNRLMHQLQLTAELGEKLRYTAALAYTDFTRKTQSIVVDKTTGKETLANAALQNTDTYDGITVRGMFDYKLSDHVSLQPGYDINYEQGSGSRLQTGTNSIGDYAAFLSADIRIGTHVRIRPGMRVVKNSVYDAPPVIPSVNIKLPLNDKHDLRASYGRGFRAPSIRELYFNFYDASHSIEGNPDLKAELSHSVNVSWNGRLVDDAAWKVASSVSLFYNTIDNMIDYGIKPGSTVTTYINIHRYKSQGFTWNNTLKYKNIEGKVGFGYTGRYNELTETDSSLPDFTWSPEVTSSVAYGLDKIGLTVSAYYKYTGKTPAYVINPSNGAIVLGEIDGYSWADASVQKRITKFLDLTVGTRNLLNVTTVSNSSPEAGSAHSGEGATRPVGYGRSYFAAITVHFKK